MEGYLESSSPEKLSTFIAVIPSILEEVKNGNHKPDFIRAYILDRLTGGTLKVLKCGSCGTKFFADKPAGTLGYYCPVCGTIFDIAVDIIKAILATTEPEHITNLKQRLPVPKQKA